LSVKAQILDFLLKNQESSFTLQELSTKLGKDKSNLAKVVRKLVSNKEIGYVQGKGGKPSIISYKNTTSIPQGIENIPQGIENIPQAPENTTSIPQAPVKKIEIPDFKPKHTPKPLPRQRKLLKARVPNFNEFMDKTKKSNSYSAKHLQEKLFVKGKFKAVNKERVIRIIRDVIDIIEE
jgi:hypothetical protein